MTKMILTCLSLFLLSVCPAQQADNYKPLDATDPILFNGEHIVYRGDTILLGPKAFFIDGQLSKEEASRYEFVYNSVNEAARHLTGGSEDDPMVLYLAPYVYWIDDPDDPNIRVPQEGQPAPYGLIIDCEWLRFYGLTEDPANVVLACNRGQTIGARGNFTMFKFIGQGTSSENITFGNYCNVDLEFPLKPELNREKRAPAIVQAQLIHCNGDKIVARNTRFISRLNLCPFVGGKRVLFDRCHFESTDDALCGTGVYLNCTFDFYSSKPFYWTRGTGSVFLNSDITSYVGGHQYFTKAGGQLALVDTRIKSATLSYLGWQDEPPLEMRNYQYHVFLNGKPVTIGIQDSASTVKMEHKKILDAYRLNHKGEVIYNTYNLLRGNDDWDPMGIRKTVIAAEKENGENYSMIPTQLLVDRTNVAIETAKDSALLTAKAFRFGNYEMQGVPVKWSVGPEAEKLVELKPGTGGSVCTIIPTNQNDETIQVTVTSSTPSGLEAASVLHVAPSKLPPPNFISMPELSSKIQGKLTVSYKLDMAFEDQSVISWYRCSDATGSNPVKVAVSRGNQPMSEYELSAGDVGYYLIASVEPKHVRCDKGEPVRVITEKPVSSSQVITDPKIIETDFRNFPTEDQPEVFPGFWTLGSFDPMFAGRARRVDNEADAWYYGEGKDGAKNMVGLIQSNYARLFYTPVKGTYGNMKLALEVAPFKTAGQGFSIAPLYMDVLVNFDANTLTGYGLRFIRTTKYHDAVDCLFVKYEHGEVTEISDPVSTSCYRAPCFITVEIKGNRIIAHAETDANVLEKTGVVKEVHIESNIIPGKAGGFGIQYAGGAPTLIKGLKSEWK